MKNSEETILPVAHHCHIGIRKQKGRELQVRASIKGPRSPTKETQSKKPRPMGALPQCRFFGRKLAVFDRNNDCVNAKLFKFSYGLLLFILLVFPSRSSIPPTVVIAATAL